MTGLRARQKADRHQRILQAASELFRKSGYEGAKIEAIAALAEVSIGTIYNYYQNKGDLLVAIVAMEVNEVLNAGRNVIARPPANVAKAVDKLIIGYIEHSLVYLSKEMWRQAMAISTQQPESPFGKTYSDLDRALIDQTCALIAQAAGTRTHPPRHRRQKRRRDDLQQHEYDVHRLREGRGHDDRRIARRDPAAEQALA